MARIGNLIRDPVALKARAVKFEHLSTMLDRITKEDINDVAQTLRDCADDIMSLLRGELVGCPCRRIEDDNYTAIVYEDACPHHGRLKREEERLKKAYADAEKKLADKLRISFFESALQGLLAGRTETSTPEILADRAIAIADAAIARLRK